MSFEKHHPGQSQFSQAAYCTISEQFPLRPLAHSPYSHSIVLGGFELMS